MVTAGERRASHLLGIYKALRTLYPENPEMVFGWMTFRNGTFGGYVWGTHTARVREGQGIGRPPPGAHALGTPASSLEVRARSAPNDF